ncbi:TPA: hypothetical protein ACNUZJ_000995 [Raoultella ornithinolytica]
MSENNYGALMMKSALSASVDIDTIFSPGIYPVLADNPSSPDSYGGILTIHSGSIKYRSFSSDRIIFAISTYNLSATSWSSWNYPVSRPELESHEPGKGASISGLEQGGTVQDAVNFLTPEMFYTGKISDHTSVFDIAIDEAIKTGRKLTLSKSVDYVVSAPIFKTLYSGNSLHIDFSGATINISGNITPFTFQNSLDGDVYPASVEDVSYNLSVSASVNTRVSKITAPGHSFIRAGEIGRIFSDDIVDDTDNVNQFKAEYFVVSAIDGDSIYTTGVLFENYKENIHVCKPSNATLVIERPCFASAWVSGHNSSAMTARGFLFPKITNFYASQLNGPGLNVTCCYMMHIGDATGVNLKNNKKDGSFGYLINDSGSFGTTGTTIKSVNSRHPYTTSLGGSLSGVTAGDNRWDLRGRTAFSHIATLIGHGDGCSYDSHAAAYKISIGKVVAIGDPRGDDVAGAAVQIRANSVRIDSVEAQNCKTGIFVSGATRTNNNFISIGHIRVASKQGSLPINLQGASNVRTKVVIDNAEFETEHDSVVYVKNANVIIKYLSGEFSPYQNGGELIELDEGSVVDVLDGDIYINSNLYHRIAVHNASDTTIRTKTRLTGGERISYLAASLSQYDVQSEFDIHIDKWSGSPFLGLPANSAKAFAKIRAGSTSYPLKYRALLIYSATLTSIDLQNAGDDILFIRMLVTVSNAVIRALTKGARPGQMLIINNHTSSSNSITLSNNTDGMLTLGSAITISVSDSASLIWDGATWRKG